MISRVFDIAANPKILACPGGGRTSGGKELFSACGLEAAADAVHHALHVCRVTAVTTIVDLPFCHRYSQV